jgi:hypothetical protein
MHAGLDLGTIKVIKKNWKIYSSRTARAGLKS